MQRVTDPYVNRAVNFLPFVQSVSPLFVMLLGGRRLVNDILGARAADCDDSQAGARTFRLSSTSSASSHGVRKCTPGSVAFADLH